MTATTSENMTASVSSRPSWQRIDIQGLRAVAVLAVIAFHADLPIPGGFTGVDIFFVISGFVITQLILREVDKGRFSLATFYARRAQRLLPALALMTAIVFLLSLLLESPFGAQQVTVQTGIGAMVLSANVVITRTLGSYFSPSAETNPLLHTWSLSVEEQFYLAFPLALIIALGVFRRWSHQSATNRPSWTPIVVVFALTLASFMLGLVWTYGWQPVEITSQPATWAFYLLPARAWEFGVGALVALVVSRHRLQPPQSWSTALGLTGAAAVVAGLLAISPLTPFPGYAALLPVLGTAVLILAGAHANPVSAALSMRPLVRVGDWSYSLYLWHWPLIVFSVLLWPESWIPLAAAAISFVPAVASYHLVENPIRARRLSRKAVAVAGVSISGIVIVLGLALLNFGGRLVPGISELEQQRNLPTLSQERGCFIEGTFRPDSLGVSSAEECWFRVDDSQGWILLAGDSHAAHASTAVVKAAEALSLDVFSITGGACPFQLAPVGYSDLSNCDDLNEYLWSMIDSDEPPSAVFLAAKGVTGDAMGTIGALEARDIPVVWLRNVPRWAPESQGIQHLPCTGGLGTFSCSFSEDEVNENQRATIDRELKLMAEYPEVPFIDARSTFCQSGECSPIQSGTLAYVDNEHLNGYGSELITQATVQALRAALRGS